MSFYASDMELCMIHKYIMRIPVTLRNASYTNSNTHVVS